MRKMVMEGTLDENLSKSPFDFLVSDDRNAKDLLNGHLNLLVKKAVGYGLSVSEAIKMVTLNPAQHYGLNSGEIAPDKIANFSLVDNLEDLNVEKVWVHGELVAENGDALFETPDCELLNNFKLSKVSPEDFNPKFEKADSGGSLMSQSTTVNIMVATNSELITDRIADDLFVENNIIQPSIKRDILKIAVLNRYGGDNIANGFIKGFGLEKGAIASSVAHDSHNVVVIGTNSEDMAKAVNLIVENKGGVSVVCDEFEDVLELPIAGLMSNKDSVYVAKKLENILDLTKKLGCSLDSPFMTLSFMALLVIPSLKISDQGLFDLTEFSFVDLIKDDLHEIIR